jgi:hypothetical protein
MDAMAGNAVCFGPFELDLEAGELRQDRAKPIRLPEQPSLILTHAGASRRRGGPRRNPEAAVTE